MVKSNRKALTRRRRVALEHHVEFRNGRRRIPGIAGNAEFAIGAGENAPDVLKLCRAFGLLEGLRA